MDITSTLSFRSLAVISRVPLKYVKRIISHADHCLGQSCCVICTSRDDFLSILSC
jgi:hypothetical protein